MLLHETSDYGMAVDCRNDCGNRKNEVMAAHLRAASSIHGKKSD